MFTGLSENNMTLIARKLSKKHFTPVQEEVSADIPKIRCESFKRMVQGINWHDVLTGKNFEEDCKRFSFITEHY